MNYYNMKPYIIYSNMVVPPTPPPGKKNISFIFFGENVSFFDVYNKLQIPVNRIKYFYVPAITKMIVSRLTGSYRKKIRSYSLYPVTGRPGDFSSIPQGRNFFIDFGSPLDLIYKRFSLVNFKTNIAIKRMSIVFNLLYSVPKEYEKTLLYSICVDEKITPIIYDKKFFAIYRMLFMWANSKGKYDIPFDKIILFFYKKGSSSGKYVLLFDKESEKNNLSRIKSIMTRLSFQETDISKEMDADIISNDVVNNTTLISDEDKKDKDFVGKAVDMIRSYLRQNKPVISSFKRVSNDYMKSVLSSIFYPVSSDKKEDKEDKKVIDKVKSDESILSPKDLFIRALKGEKENIGKEEKIDKKVEFDKKEIDPLVYNEKIPIVRKDDFIQKSEEKLNNKRNEILINSLLSHKTSRNVKISNNILKYLSRSDVSKKISEKKVIKKEIVKLLPKGKPEIISKDAIIKESGVDLIVDKVVPKHVIEKRVNDYNDLSENIKRVFSFLKNKKYPIKVVSIKVAKFVENIGELEKSHLLSFYLLLEDKWKRRYPIEFYIPAMDKNGFFYLRGNKRLIMYQLVIYPIFFLEPFRGSFSSSYSMITIESKKTKYMDYLQIYIGGYKIPLLFLLSYLYGFNKVIKDYGVRYKVSDKKPNDSKYIYKIPDKKYLVFYPENDLGEHLISVFRSLIRILGPNFRVEDINKKEFWENILIRLSGNRNFIYVINQVIKNIVTPLEIEILKNKGEPTDIYDIIKYISSKTIYGYTDPRNSLEKQRIRSSEIIYALLLKLVLASYNEYESKIDSGDKSVKFYIDPKKILSSILVSQNIQLSEYINPVEELSMKMRVSSVGIGGIPTADAIPSKYLDIHSSYYGNIDPLETPNSQTIGVQQHLTLGSGITNLYGTFIIRDKEKVKPIEILSVASSMIPFVESDEGARVTMATGQMKQAVPLLNPEQPAVQTGYESLLTTYLSDEFIKKSPINGKVVKISDDKIYLSSSNNKIETVDISPRILKSGQGKHGISVFKTKVKLGDTVKEGDLLAEGSCIVDGVISTGVNVLAAYMPWKGYNFEDGMVVSEELVDRFSSIHIEEEEVNVLSTEYVFDIVEKGKDTNKGDILLSYGPSVGDIESYKYLRSPGGRIISIEIYSNVSERKIPEPLIDVYNEFKKEYIKKYGGYPIGNFQKYGEKFDGILIKFVISQILSLKKGDKLNNRHFNKGVVSIIEKKENMPITPWGERVQIVYNPLAIVNRMISGQVLELHVGLISKKLSLLMKEKNRKEFLNILKRVIYNLDGSKDKVYYSNIVNYFSKISDVEYSKLADKIFMRGFFPLVFPPFKSPSRENILDAMDIIGVKPRYKLFLPEFNSYTDPVPVGYIYIMKLEHMSEKKLHARGTGSYLSKTLVPTRGKSRGGGQRFGEYESYSCIAWDTPHIVDEMLGPMSVDHVTKNEIISEIFKKGEAKFRYPKTNKVKDLMINYLLSINLNILGEDLYNYFK